MKDDLEEATICPPLNFRFLTALTLTGIQVESLSRETGLYLLSSCPDLEVLRLEFTEKSWIFNDFFLDEVLMINPLARLESFIVINASLTLISALRLLNSRPKLRKIGHLLRWDVEASEMTTFGQIIQRAQSLQMLPSDLIFL